MNELRVVLVVLGCGLFAAAVLPGHPPGVALLLVASVVALGVAVTLRSHLDVRFGVLAALSLILMSTVTWRDSPAVLLPSMGAALGLASLAVAGGTSWWEVVRGTMLAWWRALLTPRFVTRVVAERIPRSEGTVLWPLGRALLVTVALVGIFGGLFLSADRAFAVMAEDLVWVDISLLPARAFVFLAVAAGTCGLFLSHPAAAGVRSFGLDPFEERGTGVIADPPERRRVEPMEWVIPIAALDLLFGIFVTVQLTVLFGGRTHVLETAGLSYAEYARSGFFQLMFTAALVLVVIAAVVHLGRFEDPSQRRWARALLGMLCGLTLVILVSALRRLSLYEDAYGFTHIRLASHAATLWLGVVFVLVASAGVGWSARWLPAAVVLVTAGALLVYASIDPDRTIAERNIARFEETGKIDVGYLARLSADAAPAFTRLPEEIRSCLLVPGSFGGLDDRSWQAWNLARAQARAIVEGHADDGACTALGSYP